MVMVGERKRREVEAETGVGRGGIRGIHMAKRGRIEDIDQEIDLIADRRTGRERDILIGGNGPGATREDGMIMSLHHAGGGSGAILRICRGGGEIHEIEIVITEDDEESIHGSR